jgi:hypothetical protein
MTGFKKNVVLNSKYTYTHKTGLYTVQVRTLSLQNFIYGFFWFCVKYTGKKKKNGL